MLSCGLSPLVALTGQAAVVARASPAPSGRIGLCSANGPVTVQLDGSGHPVNDPVLCPEVAPPLILANALPLMAVKGRESVTGTVMPLTAPVASLPRMRHL